MKRISPLFLLLSVLLLAGCWQIWNASDLIEWVEQQAVRAGCDPATIELEEWYVEKEGANVWPGTCVNAQTGEAMAFEIGIDSVWKPSEVPEPTADTADEGAAIDTGALTVDALKNATYSGIYDEPVTLTDGRYEGEPFVAGDTARPRVDYLDHATLFGDLDGDGIDDAVVFLVENSGGTGNFVYVATQLNRAGRPVDAGAVLIEDRIQVRSAAIEGGQVALEIVTEGPGDAACCKSHKAAKRYALQEGRLAEVGGEDEELVRISAADLDGTSWTLLELNEGQPALAEPPVTITFQDGRINGSGGCNNYNTRFTLGEDNPFVMTITPVAATQMACPAPIADQETAYLAALPKVSQWSYWFGKLALYYLNDDGTLARLLFAPAAPAEAGQTGESLTAQPWQWISFANPMEEADVADPEQYQVTFQEDGTLAILADCNRASGTYAADAGSIQITVGPATMAACAPDSRSEQFVAYLGSAARYFYFFQDGRLFIDLFADGGTLVFDSVLE